MRVDAMTGQACGLRRGRPKGRLEAAEAPPRGPSDAQQWVRPLA